jgi:hypothetical protein
MKSSKQKFFLTPEQMKLIGKALAGTSTKTRLQARNLILGLNKIFPKKGITNRMQLLAKLMAAELGTNFCYNAGGVIERFGQILKIEADIYDEKRNIKIGGMGY